MATPKIKLYRLFPGYSSLNDNDIQSATNDQLLPVTLKNIMPTNAYTLVGVGQKKLQALIPVLSYKSSQACVNATDGVYILPNIGGIDSDDKTFNHLIVANRTNVMPIFYEQSNENQQILYKPGIDYIYVKDMQSYNKSKDVSSAIKFVLYFSQVQKQWYVKFVNQSDQPNKLYVKNIFSMLLNKITITDLNFSNIQSSYYLSKSSGVKQVVGNKHEFIPVVGEYANYHLRPTISFQVRAEQVMDSQQLQKYYLQIVNQIEGSNSSLSSVSSLTSNEDEIQSSYLTQTVVLTQQSNSFVIDQNFRLTQVNNNSIFVKFGSNEYALPSGLIYEKECTLTYYTIPKFSEISLDLHNLMFISQEQDIYNGTRDAAKPNTLYLQYVQSGKMQYNENGEVIQNYTIQTNQLKKTIQAKLEKSYDYCRGIIPLGVKGIYNFDDVCGDFRYVYNRLQHTHYIQSNYTDKKLNFPDSQYLLDVDRGLYYFRSYNTDGEYRKTKFDDNFIENNDYFFSSYYHRISITKVFVSDFQNWVTQHLRNNPDIFYGKKDYEGDDYIDANENTIKVGAIPQFLESGYTISFRNGSVTFAADTQDLDYVGTTDQQQASTNEDSGLMSGGVARANFAYYNGLQNVLDQKLQWDKDYSGGGYKYRAMTDKKYPDSIGRRWVKRQNPLQFIGASFVTQKADDKGQLKIYNLPDLQTIQLQKLGKYGFAKCMLHENYENTPKIFLDYFITTNNFSYPFVFKISNLRRLLSQNDNLYLSEMSETMLKKRHPNLMGENVDFVFDRVNAKDKFQQNQISFETLQGVLLDRINVKFSQLNILPALQVKIPVLTQKIKANTAYVQIDKNSQFDYSDFEIYSWKENKLHFESVVEFSDIDSLDKIFVEIPSQYRESQLYLKYRMTTKLYRGNEQFDAKMQFTMTEDTVNSSSSIDSSDSSYSLTENIVVVGSNYKIQKNNNSQLIFSISNVNQTTYFKLNVIDFYSVQNTYNSTIVYAIKKYDL